MGDRTISWFLPHDKLSSLLMYTEPDDRPANRLGGAFTARRRGARIWEPGWSGRLRPSKIHPVDLRGGVHFSILSGTWRWAYTPFAQRLSLTVLVVLSMLSLPCGASMTSDPVDVASACLELSVWSLASTDVRTSSWKECSLDVFVRRTVCRDLTHNLPD